MWPTSSDETARYGHPTQPGRYTFPMLPIRFEDITAEDILRLVTDKVAERKTIEYKMMLTIGTTDEKAEFLGDISSFANASGGDVIFGISDERDGSGNATGVPDEIVGLTFSNSGTVCGQIEQIIQNGIQPRLPILSVKVFDITERGIVIVVRVGKSWIAPHMVSYANRTRFYSRNSSTGRVLLDVQQIGAAFAEQRGLGERLRAWKADRISKAVSGDGPVQLTGPKLLYHFIPASAIMEEAQSYPRTFDRSKWGNGRLLMSLNTERMRYNADVLLLLSRDFPDKGLSYLQVFKNGALEYGDSYVFHAYGRDIASGNLEGYMVRAFGIALRLLSNLEVSDPVYVTLTLIGVKGKRLATPRSWEDSTPGFDRDVILCPDVEIKESLEDEPYPATLLPLVNSIWQAAGIEQTPFFMNGIWNVGDPG